MDRLTLFAELALAGAALRPADDVGSVGCGIGCGYGTDFGYSYGRGYGRGYGSVDVFGVDHVSRTELLMIRERYRWTA